MNQDEALTQLYEIVSPLPVGEYDDVVAQLDKLIQTLVPKDPILEAVLAAEAELDAQEAKQNQAPPNQMVYGISANPPPTTVNGCPKHNPQQHRDARPPWCNACGWGVDETGRPFHKNSPFKQKTRRAVL